METQWQTTAGITGGQLAIGLPELRALVSAAFDAVTGTDGWEDRSNEALRSVDSKHRTELLTSTICLVERAVRSKTITTAAKDGRAAGVLEERMLPVGFPRDFIGQLAHCLELCFENRRELRKAKKTAKVVRRTTGTTAAAPPPPPQEQPPPLRMGLPPGASAEGGAGALPPQVVDHRKFGGVALPGFDRPSAAPAPAQHNTSGLQPAAQPHGAFAGGADGAAAAAPPAAAAAAEGGVGQISPASARALRDQVRPPCSPTLPGLRCRFALCGRSCRVAASDRRCVAGRCSFQAERDRVAREAVLKAGPPKRRVEGQQLPSLDF